MEKLKKKQDRYCVICEVEGVKTKATDELDVGYGPAPVCSKCKQDYKEEQFENEDF